MGVSFATALLCMDGRILDEVRDFCRRQLGDFAIDEVTEPGIVRILAGKPPIFPDQPLELVPWIRRKSVVSVDKHGSRHAVVVGHMHCAGNIVPDSDHYEDIHAAVEVVQSWHLFDVVVGLWAYESASGKWALRPIVGELPDMRLARVG